MSGGGAGNGEYYEARLREVERKLADSHAQVIAAVRESAEQLHRHVRMISDELQNLREFIAERLPKPKRRKP